MEDLQKPLHERHKIPLWANVVDVTWEEGILTVDFDNEDEDILEDEDL